jgi:hypothetical protein
MNRKEFIIKSFQTICGCGAVSCLMAMGEQGSAMGQAPSGAPASIRADLERRALAGAQTPADVKAEKAVAWIKHLMDNMDDLLDEKTRINLLNACGRSCFIRAYGVADENRPAPEQAERYLRALEAAGCSVERGAETTVIHYGWQGKQNPWGLSLKEGYCLCNIMESEHTGLSPTYCNCSAGYVKEGIERFTGRIVEQVTVLESLKMGGKDCRFRVVLHNS